MKPPPNDYCYEDIAVGLKIEHGYAIRPEVYEAFLEAFHDFSPVHVDQNYARTAGFAGRVMHGAQLNGFLSHFVGMIFPGRRSLLLAVDLRYLQPSYLGDELQLTAGVTQKLDVKKVIILDLVFQNLTQKTIAARGRAQVMLRDLP
jgi:3-hydroxybutyryl-CoA dehydratase